VSDASSELIAISKAYEASGGNPVVLFDDRIGSLVVSHHKVLRSNRPPGVVMESEETPTGVKAWIAVEPGTAVQDPVHLCFGVLPKNGLQEIISQFDIGDGARVKFVAHCTFPNAERVRHIMDAKIRVGRGAEMDYSETHYHGPEGGVEVLPTARILVEPGGVYRSRFKLTQGAAGTVKLDYQADLREDAVCEMDAKIYGKKNDQIVISESLLLNGAGARGLAKSRVVSSDHCVSEVIGEAVGNAPGARGHIDCVEILKGPHARASAVPRLIVLDESAKLTHEAAIGSVDKKQVETLMSRGLSEEEAVDVVVKGMLR